MAKAALMNQEVEKGRAARRGGGAAGHHLADQAAPRFDRAVHERRPRRSRGQGGGRDRVARSATSRRPWTRPRSNRPSTKPSPKPARRRPRTSGGDEGGDAEACRTRRRRQGRQRPGPQEARRVNPPNLFDATFRLIILKGTHKPLIHPPLGSCPQTGAFFCTERPESARSRVRVFHIRTCQQFEPRAGRRLYTTVA